MYVAKLDQILKYIISYGFSASPLPFLLDTHHGWVLPTILQVDAHHGFLLLTIVFINRLGVISELIRNLKIEQRLHCLKSVFI
jgi:hypothetical protein